MYEKKKNGEVKRRYILCGEEIKIVNVGKTEGKKIIIMTSIRVRNVPPATFDSITKSSETMKPFVVSNVCLACESRTKCKLM